MSAKKTKNIQLSKFLKRLSIYTRVPSFALQVNSFFRQCSILSFHAIFCQTSFLLVFKSLESLGSTPGEYGGCSTDLQHSRLQIIFLHGSVLFWKVFVVTRIQVWGIWRIFNQFKADFSYCSCSARVCFRVSVDILQILLNYPQNLELEPSALIASSNNFSFLVLHFNTDISLVRNHSSLVSRFTIQLLVYTYQFLILSGHKYICFCLKMGQDQSNGTSPYTVCA